MILSVDQNATSLWDVPPKLAALSAAGQAVTHLLEDIDTAFTDVGGHSDALHIGREAYHPTGGLSWGAALFYTDFLGRLPVDPHSLQPYLGQSFTALAKQLGEDHHTLFSDLAVGDNWMLLGKSYAGEKQFHRLIGDLSFAETLPLWRALTDLAEEKCKHRFPAAESQAALARFFQAERSLLARLEAELPKAASFVQANLAYLHHDSLLAEGPVDFDYCSTLFSLAACGENVFLNLFLDDYKQLASLYNQALEETAVGIRTLKISAGELPYFAIFHHEGQLVRTGCHLDGRTLRVGDLEFPLTSTGRLDTAAMSRAGILAMSPKAVLMILVLRREGALAMPHLGSLYTPASFRFEKLLREAELFTEPLAPILRVHFDLFSHMTDLNTPVTLPAYLVRMAGAEQLPASELSRHAPKWITDAKSTLEQLSTPDGRGEWEAIKFGDLSKKLVDFETKKRDLAKFDPKNPSIRAIWKEIKAGRDEIARGLLQTVAEAHWIADLEYTSARGAIRPWCLALAGEPFYQHVIKNARFTEENCDI